MYDVFEAFASIPEHVHQELVEELRKTSETEIEYHKRQISRIQTEYNRTQQRIESLLDLRLDQSITPELYDKKLNELKDTQYRLNIEMEEHTKADHEYHIQVSTVISLSKRMGEIFESSEPEEKRSLLAFLLQNPTVTGKKLNFTLRNPFGLVLELAQSPSWYTLVYGTKLELIWLALANYHPNKLLFTDTHQKYKGYLIGFAGANHNIFDENSY